MIKQKDAQFFAQFIIDHHVGRRQSRGKTADGARGYVFQCRCCFEFAQGDSKQDIHHAIYCAVRRAQRALAVKEQA